MFDNIKYNESKEFFIQTDCADLTQYCSHTTDYLTKKRSFDSVLSPPDKLIHRIISIVTTELTNGSV